MFPRGLTPPETGLCLITAEAVAFKVRLEPHAVPSTRPGWR